MTSRFEADLDAVFFTDFAEPATCRGACVHGLFRATDQRLTDLDGQLVPIQTTSLRVPTAVFAPQAAWADVRVDDVCTVRGRAYRVRDKQLEQDGAVTVVVLA